MQTHRYLSLWLVVAVGLGGLLGLAELRRNPLNDPDPARQRTGVLVPAGRERSRAIALQPDAGRHTVAIFARSLRGRHLFPDLADQSDLTRMAALVVVTQDGSRPIIEAGIDRFVADQDGSLAQGVGLRHPIDGGYPVGYVLIDAQGFIRYRTLDPGFDGRAWEAKLLLSEMME